MHLPRNDAETEKVDFNKKSIFLFRKNLALIVNQKYICPPAIQTQNVCLLQNRHRLKKNPSFQVGLNDLGKTSNVR